MVGEIRQNIKLSIWLPEREEHNGLYFLVAFTIISKVLSSGQKLYAIFIDYEKCFDKIDHMVLWQKLVGSKMTKAIKAMKKKKKNLFHKYRPIGP